MAINPKRGEIWQVNLEPTIGQEIKKSRPAVVISSDLFATIDLRIIIPITGWQDKFSQRPFMVKISKDGFNGLDKDSAGNVLQVRNALSKTLLQSWNFSINKILSRILLNPILSDIKLILEKLLIIIKCRIYPVPISPNLPFYFSKLVLSVLVVRLPISL